MAHINGLSLASGSTARVEAARVGLEIDFNDLWPKLCVKKFTHNDFCVK
jgi:hypothetical protein